MTNEDFIKKHSLQVVVSAEKSRAKKAVFAYVSEKCPKVLAKALQSQR